MNFLYNLLIQPLIMAYDILFTLLYGLIEDPVLSIIVFSIVINFIILPLYRKADEIQKEEHEKEKKMKPWVNHIRRYFKGDERFMVLSAYYKIEHYNPLSALREAGPLFLQIPFFIAAYRYISSIPVLEGASFGAINDLLQPDGLLMVAGMPINVLPIVMTVINIISGIIYSKDAILRQKIQIYGLALVFLVLLYNSPSGLVIYWIMNNLFSLCKNIYFSHEPKNKRVLSTLIAVIIISVISCLTVLGRIDSRKDILLSECILICAVVKIVMTVIRLYHVQISEEWINFFFNVERSDRETVTLIILPELALVLLLGFYIPATILSASPIEFVDLSTATSQTYLLTTTITVYVGLLLVWTTVIVLSADEKKRQWGIILLWCVLGVTLINQFLFPANINSLYPDLSFDRKLMFSAFSVILNILCCILVCVCFITLYKKSFRLLIRIGAIISITLLCVGMIDAYNFIRISRVQEKIIQSDTRLSDKPIRLSKDGKNVVVIMLDRAIGGYVPYIFDEIPELKNSFEGFEFYPNTISFGEHTNFGAPGIFGGYEYTPYESNKRNTVSLKDKHNEALKLMPKLFQDAGFDVTVCDPPYANYQDIPDLSIYDDLPGVHAYNLTGKFSTRLKRLLSGNYESRQKRNFFMYGVFRTAPLLLRDIIYDDGKYISIYMPRYYPDTFIDSYSVLERLNTITDINSDKNGAFLMLQNDMPHNPVALNPPDYTIDNKKIVNDYNYENKILDGRILKIENERQWKHYCTNVATYKAIGAWLDFLKDEGIYDNTRIILVADHGYYLSQFDDLMHPDGLDIEALNPLLMVKDFGANEQWSINNEFMTNADVPELAMRDVIRNPVNPFTGKRIESGYKQKEIMIVTDSSEFRLDENNGTEFDLGDGNWWSIHDDIFDLNNWNKIWERRD